MQHEANSPERATPWVGRPLASILALVAGLPRVIPHPFNLTPVGALCLFGGARLRSWQAFALPLGVMIVTDFLLWVTTGFNFDYSPLHVSRAFVYGSLLVYVLLGRTLTATESPGRIGAASLLGSLQFFLITNFGTWATENLYPHTLEGILACYAAGLPFYNPGHPLGFFGYTVLGDLGFSACLFALHAWLSRTAFPAERVPAPAE
jgi:hypothetical protein